MTTEPGILAYQPREHNNTRGKSEQANKPMEKLHTAQSMACTIISRELQLQAVVLATYQIISFNFSFSHDKNQF